MIEISQGLIILGAAIFGLLGTVHLLYTFFTNKFDARDDQVTAAMKNTSPVLTNETSVWKAWIGFNASHSLGAILVAAVYIPLAVGHMGLIVGSLWFSMLPVVVGFSYLALARRYWFKIPFTGVLISTVCFTLAALLINI